MCKNIYTYKHIYKLTNAKFPVNVFELNFPQVILSIPTIYMKMVELKLSQPFPEVG